MEKSPLLDALKTGSGRVCLIMGSATIPRLYPILQAGFFVRSLVGTTVTAFLKNQLELSVKYIEERISTIFLNGKPVDNIDAAIVEEGSTLALSSAMPGLVGATMRRKGPYASLRNAITYKDRVVGGTSVKEGAVRLKLFNLVMADLGPLLLKRGIYVSLRDFREFLAGQHSRFYEEVVGATVEGQPIEPASLGRADLLAGVEWAEVRACESP
jgi:hypothetical protein